MQHRPVNACQRPVLTAGVALLIAMAGGGCSQSCTDVGGLNGISVGIPADLYVDTGSALVEVCDDEGCAKAAKELGRLPGNAGPEARSAFVTFEDLARDFSPGIVTVHVELLSATGGLVARRSGSVELSQNHPNGQGCDGEGYVSGALMLQPSDAAA